MNETQPLLGHTIEYEQATTEHPLVDFDPNGDLENPKDWSPAYKRVIVLLLAFMSFTVTFTCIGVVPVAEKIAYDLEGKENKSASILLVTIWELGEAVGPLLIAPLSEIYGRYPVFNVANVMFIIGGTLAAMSPTTNLFVFSRFLTGAATASNVLNPSVIGDLFPAEAQGSVMSLVQLAPLIGGAVGPAISGAIAETFGWRTTLWASVLVAIICEFFFFTLFRETYKVTILQRRAARLRRESKDSSLKCAYEAAGKKLWWSTLRTSIKRPVVVLSDSIVLKILALYGGLTFAFYYILATTLPGILRENYGFSPSLVGTAFLTLSAGATGGVIISNLLSDKIYTLLGKSRGRNLPEYRLPLMIVGGALLPLTLALYGWAPAAHWPVSFLQVAVASFGMMETLILVPLTLYIVETFGIYSASGTTMLLVLRCIGGTLLPLTIPPLTDALGLGYGFLVLAGICLVLLPLPIVLMRYGAVWRQRSAYTRDQ